MYNHDTCSLKAHAKLIAIEALSNLHTPYSLKTLFEHCIKNLSQNRENAINTIAAALNLEDQDLIIERHYVNSNFFDDPINFYQEIMSEIFNSALENITNIDDDFINSRDALITIKEVFEN